MNQDTTKIPQATAKRLPLYYRFIKNLYSSGKQRVSSKELSESVKVDSATIRRDFSYFGALGKKGYGYNVNYLLSFFRKTLDQDAITKVVLIGVGNLGTAFLHYNFIKIIILRLKWLLKWMKRRLGHKSAMYPFII